MTRHSMPALAGSLLIATALAASGIGHAGTLKARTDAGATEDRAERRDTRPGIGEKVRICCRAQPKIRYYKVHPDVCRKRGHQVVRRFWCSGRSVSDKPGELVCCVKSDVDLFPSPEIRSRGVVTTRKRCGLRKGGWKAASSMGACAKKRSVRDRKRECRKRGKGWVWKNNRCMRASVRDRRSP